MLLQPAHKVRDALGLNRRRPPRAGLRRLDNFDLSYVSPDDPLWRRALLRAIENASGRRRLLPIYREWSAKWGGQPGMMDALLPLIGSRLDIQAPHGRRRFRPALRW